MTSPIGAVNPVRPLSLAPDATARIPNLVSRSKPDFQKLLLQSLEQVSAMEQQADVGVLQSLTGDDLTQVEVLSAVKKAELALRLMLQIRNKILEAYQQIQQMRM